MLSRPARFVTSFLLLGLILANPAAAGDVHSYANFEAFRQQHLSLDLVIDFEARQLVGTANIRFERTDNAGRTLVLDTRDLLIRSVTLDNSTDPLAFEISANDKILGRALRIQLPDELPTDFTVSICYETSPGASGLQWLNPRQTAGGKHPFLFSQSQAIHARSWVPIQDTPSVRFTYDAEIATPPGLLAVMSADNDPAAERDGEYTFRMQQRIPSYLLAIAAGNLEFAPIGPRTGVYAEPEMLQASVSEFEDTEKMLTISEGLFGPYRWDRYDLLILPPSFPYGGMENPRLSFITPTVLAGDKSLVSLIAHELAHSWSGNLVTNATWSDMWLNEGFTVFLESRITEALYGERQRIMEERLGYEDLLADLATMEPAFQKLKTELKGADPDLVFSNVPYEKGRLMLVWLDQQYGREVMNAFLARYFDEFAFGSITTEEFLAYLNTNLLQKYPGTISLDDVHAWVYEPGLPASAPQPPSDVFTHVDAARNGWLNKKIKASSIDTKNWSTQDWLFFLNNMPESLNAKQMKELDKAFGLTDAGNNEIAHSWLVMAIRNNYRPAWPRLENYLKSIGRNKLVKPLYTELMKTKDGAEFARRVFEEAKPGYHPLTVTVNSNILYPDN